MNSKQVYYTLDDKGRLSIPSFIRNTIGDSFTVTRGLTEPCLYIYSQTEWESLCNAVKKFKLNDENARNFERVFIGGSCPCNVDKQGRILLSQNLRAFAGLTKDVTILALTNRFEIWDTATYYDIFASYVMPEGGIEGLDF